MGAWDSIFSQGTGNNIQRSGLENNAQNAQNFAGQGAANYNNFTGGIQNSANYLQQIANGQHSVSAEQLRQALAQNQAQQMSMAAGASPQNQAMAARTAMIQSGRLGAGLAGQQSLAGLQERNQAQQALGQLLLGARGQDVNAATGGYGAANQGYAAALNPNGDKSWWDKYGAPLAGAAAGAASTYATGGASAGAGAGGMGAGGGSFGSGMGSGAAMSDKRLKTDIADGEGDARKTLEALKSYSFRYKPDKQQYGEGKQLGVMAQDLERALPQAVVDTPQGKAVNGAKLATALAAMMPGLNKRISELEGDKG